MTKSQTINLWFRRYYFGERNSNKRINVILCLIFIILPFIIAALGLKLLNSNYSVFKSFPYYSDEWGYYKQVEAMINYGKPLGYWGYNSGHATWGTMGPHGYALLVPYCIMGMLFGLHLNSITIYNIILLCMANLCFVILTRPDDRQLIRLSVVNFLLFIKFQYSISSMTEPLKFSLAIILAGMFYKLRFHKSSKIFKFVIVPLFIVYCSHAYLIFSVFVPIYLFLILTKMGQFIRVLVALAVTLVFVFFTYCIWTNISAPYVGGGAINNTFGEILQSPIIGGLSLLRDTLVNVVKSTFFHTGMTEYFSWFFSLWWFLILSIAGHLLYRALRKDNCFIDMICIYTLVSFLVLHFFFGIGEISWTLLRGLNNALCIVFYLLCLHENVIIPAWGGVIICLVGIHINFATWTEVITKERFYDKEFIEEVEKEREDFQKIFVLTESMEEPWNNTLSIYYESGYNGHKFVFALPKGIGINTMMDEDASLKSKYVMISRGNSIEREQDLKKRIELEGYLEIFTNEECVIFAQ